MSTINKKRLKEKFSKNRIKAGNAVIRAFIKIVEKEIDENIEKLARKLRIEGRKIVKEADFKEILLQN